MSSTSERREESEAASMAMKGIILVALSVCACRTPTMAGVLSDKQSGAGVTKTYPVSSDQAWEIATRVLRWEGAAALEQHRENGFMLTTVYNRYAASTVGPVSYVGAWVEPAPDGSRVTCVVEGQSFSEELFHQRFVQAVALAKRGELPLAAPPAPAEELARCTTSSECDTGLCLEGRCRR